MIECIMCKQQVEETDFLGRCIPCFHKYVEMKDEDKPNVGVPFVPIYNGDK